MKIKHSVPKCKRVFCSTYKPYPDETQFNKRWHRIPFYDSIQIISGDCPEWWSETLKKWISIQECIERGNAYPLSTQCRGIHSVKAAIRHIGKHDEIPKGSVCLLASPLEFHVFITK